VDLCASYRDRAYFFGCNDSYKLVPFLDLLYACDLRWWEYHHDKVYDTYKWTSNKEASDKFSLNYIEGHSLPDLCLDKFAIHYGFNSGYQLINLAYHFGVREFYLVGYDMRANGHFFGNHPWPLVTTSPYELFISRYKTITLPSIVNCTPGSALTVFPYKDLEECLKTFPIATTQTL
jgi:hypothetical protein